MCSSSVPEVICTTFLPCSVYFVATPLTVFCTRKPSALYTNSAVTPDFCIFCSCRPFCQVYVHVPSFSGLPIASYAMAFPLTAVSLSRHVASPQVLGSISIQLFHQATSCAFRYIAQSIECFPFYCKYIFVKVGWLILEFHSSTRCVTGILNLVWRDFCPRHCQIRKSCTFPPARHF